MARPRFEAHPLTPERFDDLVTLFSRPGGSMARGCYCMYYRESGRRAGAVNERTNRRALRTLVNRGTVPGLIGYLDGRPVGWISLGPREEYRRLEKSPVMKAVDDKPVWSIVCLFVESHSRRRGLTRQLLRAAVDYARSRGATLLEAYPVDKPERSHSDFMWFGARSLYDREGFREVARRRPTRPVMRRGLRPRRSGRRRL